MNRYGGTSRDTSATHVTPDARPGGGGGVSLQLGRQARRFGAALRLSLATPGFAIDGSGINLTDRTTGRLFESALILSTRVGGIGPSGAIRAELGPALHLWDFDGEFRARIGGIGALSYEWPVSNRFSGAIRLEGMLSKSWFNKEEVPPEFERHSTRRYGVGIGLRYRL